MPVVMDFAIDSPPAQVKLRSLEKEEPKQKPIKREAPKIRAPKQSTYERLREKFD